MSENETKLQKAIRTLDEAIPEPNNKMVDRAHLEICTAWMEIKEALRGKNKDQETGRWIEKEESGNLYCSRCGFTLDDEGYYSNEVQAQEINTARTAAGRWNGQEGDRMNKTCKGCYAAETGGHPMSGEPHGCNLGYKTDGQGHPKEECPKPKSWKQYQREGGRK